MVNLQKITSDNFNECIKLETNEDQKGFVASNLRSLAESYIALTNNECIPIPYAIYNNDIMVGFILLSYNEANKNNTENTYWICRLMIDKLYQRKGYSKEAILKALDLIRSSTYGKASVVSLSYEPENVIAKKLYASFGFMETGEVDDGELVAKLIL